MSPGRSFRAILALAGALAIAVVLPAVAVAGGGNSAAAHRCQMGGWQTLQDASGNAFADQSACVSYAAGGGSLFHPTASVSTRVGSGTFNGRTCCFFFLDMTGSGFHASSAITLHFTYSTSPYSDNEYTYSAGFSTGSNGSFSSVGHWIQNCLVPGDTVSGTLTFIDASGVSASAEFTGTCNTVGG